MKVQIVGKALVITSSLKVKDIKRAKNICPEALQLLDDKKNVLFSLDVTSNKNAGVGVFGANFDAETSDGFAQVTGLMDKALTREQLADQFGMSFIRLAQVEEQFAVKYSAASSQLDAAIAGVEGVE